MPTPKERLSYLLELAKQGPQQRAALAEEVTNLLLDWPSQYPPVMRSTFETLLEKIAREIDFTSRRALAARFDGHSNAPLAVLNQLFLAAPPRMKDAILARNDGGNNVTLIKLDGNALMSIARSQGDIISALAMQAGISCATASEIVNDDTGRALAVVCKGASLSRAIFSGLVLLAGSARKTHDIFSLLTIHDRVPVNASARLLEVWRSRPVNDGKAQVAAA